MLHEGLEEQEERCLQFIGSVFQNAINEVSIMSEKIDNDFKIGMAPFGGEIEVELM